jgi:hypothetical protein
VGGEGATNLGEKRAEEAIPQWAEARRRKGGAAVLGARAGPEAALYRQMEREEEGESEQCFDFEPLRGRPGDHGGRQRCRRAALAIPQAAWHSGKEPAEEARAVEERWGDTWAREEQEVDGGGQGRRTAPATEEPED